MEEPLILATYNNNFYFGINTRRGLIELDPKFGAFSMETTKYTVEEG